MGCASTDPIKLAKRMQPLPLQPASEDYSHIFDDIPENYIMLQLHILSHLACLMIPQSHLMRGLHNATVTQLHTVTLCLFDDTPVTLNERITYIMLQLHTVTLSLSNDTPVAVDDMPGGLHNATVTYCHT